MSKIFIYLLDHLNDLKDEANMIKPNTYKELLIKIKQKFKNLSQNFDIFIKDKNNNDVIINNQEQYNTIIEDIIFIRERDNINISRSLFSLNYNKLSDSKRDLLDEKYNCILCSEIIKNEKPYLCYKCQKIYHIKCLKTWDLKCKFQNKVLECPNCRNVLPIEKWNKKLNYEDIRKDDAKLINKINEYKLKNTMNNNLNKIKEKRIKELQNKNNKQFEIIKKYEKYMNKTIDIFLNILNKLKIIHTSLKLKNNKRLNDLIDKNSLQYDNIRDISNIINEELDNINNYIIYNINKSKTTLLNRINTYNNDMNKEYNNLKNQSCIQNKYNNNFNSNITINSTNLNLNDAIINDSSLDESKLILKNDEIIRVKLVIEPLVISPSLRCDICLDLVMNPVECQKCSKIFCKYCIDDWLLKEKECPNKHPFIKKELGNYLKKSLDKIILLCPYNGCTSNHNYNNWLDHVKSCSFKSTGIKNISDEETIDYEDVDESSLQKHVRIIVKDMIGKSRILSLPINSTVKELKGKLSDKIKIKIEKQRLMYHGKELEDSTLLEDYGMHDYDIIYQLAQLK